jgi:hypothetical protein
MVILPEVENIAIGAMILVSDFGYHGSKVIHRIA